VLTAAGAESSKLAGSSSMIATNIGGATALPSVDRPDAAVSADVPAGTVQVAVPYTSRWKLTINGTDIPARPAFGLTTAFDVATPGRATVSFQKTTLHSLLVFVQFVAWIVLIFIATSRRKYSLRRTRPVEAVVINEPAIVLNEAGQS
jgi:uncharacterized membrane protein (GlpM family)